MGSVVDVPVRLPEPLISKSTPMRSTGTRRGGSRVLSPLECHCLRKTARMVQSKQLMMECRERRKIYVPEGNLSTKRSVVASTAKNHDLYLIPTLPT